MPRTPRSTMETMPVVEQLDSRFGIPGVAKINEGNGGLPRIQITGPGAEGEMYLHGAQVTSWKPGGNDEVLFLSTKSRWQEGQAIRGGIPICFPWFRAKRDDPKAPTKLGAGGLRTFVLCIVLFLALSSFWSSPAPTPAKPACVWKRPSTPTIECPTSRTCGCRVWILCNSSTIPTQTERGFKMVTSRLPRRLTTPLWPRRPTLICWIRSATVTFD